MMKSLALHRSDLYLYSHGHLISFLYDPAWGNSVKVHVIFAAVMCGWNGASRIAILNVGRSTDGDQNILVFLFARTPLLIIFPEILQSISHCARFTTSRVLQLSNNTMEYMLNSNDLSLNDLN